MGSDPKTEAGPVGLRDKFAESARRWREEADAARRGNVRSSMSGESDLPTHVLATVRAQTFEAAVASTNELLTTLDREARLLDLTDRDTLAIVIRDTLNLWAGQSIPRRPSDWSWQIADAILARHGLRLAQPATHLSPPELSHRLDERPCGCDACMDVLAEEAGVAWDKLTAHEQATLRVEQSGDARLVSPADRGSEGTTLNWHLATAIEARLGQREDAPLDAEPKP